MTILNTLSTPLFPSSTFHLFIFKARLGLARRGKARQGKAGQGKAGHGKGAKAQTQKVIKNGL